MDKILDRIKKLLRLAEGTSNPNEAANAAAAAQKLIQEHNLGMVSLEDESVEYRQTRYADEPVGQAEISMPGGKLPRWECALLQSVCRRNSARVLFVGQTAGAHRYTILGAEKDRDTVIYLFHYLRRQVDAVTTRACVGKGRTFANNFRLGMVETINNRLFDMEKQTRAQAPAQAYTRGGENAIAIVNESLAATDAIERRVVSLMKTALESTRTKSHNWGNASHDASARDAGRRAGQNVNIAPGKALAKSNGP